MTDIFGDENYFSESFTCIDDQLCLFPQLELPLHDLFSEPPSPADSELPTSCEDATSNDSDVLMMPAVAPQPHTDTEGEEEDDRRNNSLVSTLKSICSAKSWSKLSYQRRVGLAQQLSQVFQSPRLPDSDKFHLTRLIVPPSVLLDCHSDTLDIDLSLLTDERLGAVQEFLQEVVGATANNSMGGGRRPRGRPRSGNNSAPRVNQLKHRAEVQAHIGLLRRNHRHIFSREQVVAVTRDSDEEETVDVLG